MDSTPSLEIPLAHIYTYFSDTYLKLTNCAQLNVDNIIYSFHEENLNLGSLRALRKQQT